MKVPWSEWSSPVSAVRVRLCQITQAEAQLRPFLLLHPCGARPPGGRRKVLFLLNRTESTHSHKHSGDTSESSGQERSRDTNERDTKHQSCCCTGDDKPAFG